MKTKYKLVDNAAELRVKVAQDAIAQVRAEKYIERPGIYLRTHHTERERVKREGVRQYYERLTAEPCQVCAWGALFVSSLKVCGSMVNPDLNAQGCFVKGIAAKLEQVFSEDQLFLMEHYFENKGWDIERIAQNVIDNNGEFKP